MSFVNSVLPHSTDSVFPNVFPHIRSERIKSHYHWQTQKPGTAVRDSCSSPRLWVASLAQKNEVLCRPSLCGARQQGPLLILLLAERFPGAQKLPGRGEAGPLCGCCLCAVPLHVSPGLAWRSCDVYCLRLSLLCFFPLQFLSLPPAHSFCHSPTLSSVFSLYSLPSFHVRVGSCSMWICSVGAWGPSHSPSAPPMPTVLC